MGNKKSGSAIKYLIITIFIVIVNSNAFTQTNDNLSFLSTPTGKYKIGTKELFLTDSSRLEKFSKKKPFRKIAIKIWYPASNEIDPIKEPYLSAYPTNTLYEIFKSKGVKVPFLDSIKKLKTNSSNCPPISSDINKFPVLVFSSGYYFGMTDLYTSILENLASNGYIICCITHPYEQPYIKFPNNEEIYINKGKTRLAYLQLLITNKLQFRKRNTHKKVEIITRNILKKLKRFDKALKLWTDDTKFFMNYIIEKNSDKNDFFNKIDTSKIGVFGHSFGGAVSGQMCKFDKRIKAGLNLDCFQFGNIIDNPIEVPFMLIQSSNYPDWNLANTIIYENIQSNFYLLSLLNASHFIFSDAAVIPFENQTIAENFLGKVNGRTTMTTINSYILSFFDLYLKNKSNQLLEEKLDNNEIKFDFKRH
ncbi:MAG: hypothetical protein WCK02_15810 [Bacteroidota bacterium]